MSCYVCCVCCVASDMLCVCVSEIVGMAYNPFKNEDIRDCFFDYEQAVLL